MYVHTSAMPDNSSNVAFNLNVTEKLNNVISVLRDIKYSLTTFDCLYT